MKVNEKNQEKPAEKPHYHGHRDRLRQKFLESGPDALADYELLELVLFLAIPQRDVKPLAKILIAAFGSLAEVMNAPIESLVKIEGIKENTAIALKSMTALSHRAMKGEIMNKPVMNSWSRVLDYCRATMAHEAREHFRILFLNKKNDLIADEIQSSGTIDHTPAYPREVMKRALELGATAIILVHNHPSGDLKPSRDDIELTRRVVAAGAPLSIEVLDHIIVAKTGYASLKIWG